MPNSAKKYDLLIKNVRVVRPKRSAVQRMDIAVKDGKFAKVGKDLRAADAATVVDGKDRLAFPGLVDPHMHCGIYGPLAEDALSESRAAAPATGVAARAFCTRTCLRRPGPPGAGTSGRGALGFRCGARPPGAAPVSGV